MLISHRLSLLGMPQKLPEKCNQKIETIENEAVKSSNN